MNGLTSPLLQLFSHGLTAEFNSQFYEGEVKLVPTDTVPGLVARLFDRAAVEKIFELKRRARTKKLPVFCADLEQARSIALIPESNFIQSILQHFWPGALTGIFDSILEPPPYLGDGPDNTIALRVPADPKIIQLCRINGPLAQTSANLSGQPVEGVASTIVDFRDPKGWKVLRQGAISKSQIEELLELRT